MISYVLFVSISARVIELLKKGVCIVTTVYFIRHAEADNTDSDGRNRPLTGKGMKDRALVTAFLQDKNIDAVLSSPYKRAIDTLADFSEKNGFNIETNEDFREHNVGAWRERNDGSWIEEYSHFITVVCKKQYTDFTYKYPNGESLFEVQERNIKALNEALSRYKNKNIVIGTHGAALSTIIRYFDPAYGYDDFVAMVDIMPWAVKMVFSESAFIRMEKIDLFK